MKQKKSRYGKDERIRIGVIGGRQAEKNTLDKAYEVGSLIAGKNAILVCGGGGGVMEAASRGAFEKGGEIVGILPGTDTDEANDFITIPIATGMGYARNEIIVLTSDILIAIGGGYGTLSEIALGLKHGKDVINLGSWNIDIPVVHAGGPREAVELAFSLIRKGGT
jgi:uncharacterized protein (TIGR00725 family)